MLLSNFQAKRVNTIAKIVYFFYNISDDAEVWETHAFKSTIINCREL